jgi:hypothetical protein
MLYKVRDVAPLGGLPPKVIASSGTSVQLNLASTEICYLGVWGCGYLWLSVMKDDNANAYLINEGCLVLKRKGRTGI